jgi:hypothetical protein
VNLVYLFCNLFSESWPFFIIVLLCWKKDRNDFFKMLALTMVFSVTLNVMLKEFWMVPLDPALKNNSWWGFPSGHIQDMTLFFLSYFFYSEKRKILVPILALILYFTNQSFKYNHYHDSIEVIAGISIAVILTCLLFLFYSFYLQQKIVIFLYGIACIITSIIMLVKFNKNAGYYTWVISMIGSSIGIFLSLIVNLYFRPRSQFTPLIDLSFAFFFSVLFLLSAYLSKNSIMLINSISYFALFFMICCVYPIVMSKFKKTRNAF